MRRGGKGRRATTAGLMVGLLAPSLVLLLPSGARAAVTFDVVNGTANAGAEHVVAGTDAFPNFRTGAVDNYYPLAHAHIDNSPSSEGRASPADTGPVGQTGAATAGVSQPQYADAVYPPGSSKPVTVGEPGGPYAQATATQTGAGSSATAASTRAAALPGGAPPASASPSSAVAVPTLTAAQTALLRALLLQWRRHFLTADDAARYVMPAAAAEPDGADGGASTTTAQLDQAAGALVVTGDARVSGASFGSGMVSLRSVHVGVTITNDGKPRHDIAIEVGGATVAGVPVTVGAGGVSVAASQVPGLSGANDQADAALNQALAQAGLKVFTVAPQITASAHQETIDASGVHITFVQPAVGNGVPNQNAEQILGDVNVDNLAVPAEATPGTGSVSGESSGVGAFLSPSAPQTVFTPGAPGTPAVPGTPGASGSLQPAVTPRLAAKTVRDRPLWLLLLYFLWQSVLVGTVAALYWRRAGMRA